MTPLGPFDVIIVGAGSAGCVLASRLSANPALRVCLVEAGPEDRSALIDTPLGIAGLLRGRRYNWAYETTSQAALQGRRLYWPRGKTLGGSSSINAMVYMRGHPGDYDAWAAQGHAGWGWQNVLPIFMEHERQQHGAGALHGADGPLDVHDLLDPNPLSLAFVEAGVQAGLPRRADFNGPAMEGVGLYQVTQRDGRRWSASRAFLDPMRQRANLTVLTKCLATRVLLEQHRAVGLRVRQHGHEHDLTARREVMLCGGAVNSPQLLMLSGIGPGAHLQAMGIATVVDLPGVGGNLQDHLDVTLAARDGTAAAVGVGFGTLPRLLREALKLRKQGRGMLTSNAAEAGGFASTRPGLERPDVQFHFLPTLLRDHGRKLVWGYGYTLHVCQLRPRSRGCITLATSDADTAPQIDPMYLSHAEDLDVLREGLRLAHPILTAPAWQAFAANRREPWPDMRNDAALDAYMRGNAETIYHPGARAAWVRTTAPWWTAAYASVAWRVCVWRTPPSCRTSSAATQARRA